MKGIQNYQMKGKELKLQWLQDTNQINGGNLNSVRREASRHFGNKRNIWNRKLMRLKQTVRTRTLETYVEA
jgi:hypothetical protein